MLKRNLTLALFVCAAASAMAGDFTLYNTGIGPSGPIAAGAADPYWSVTPNGAGNGTPVVLSSQNRYGQWVPDTSTAQWISTADTINTGTPGTYTYSQSFDLSGYDPSSAFIAGWWTADDQMATIMVNGSSVGVDGLGGASIGGGWGTPHAFFIAPGLDMHAGINTISFVTGNSDNNFEGIDAQLVGCANPTPEPSSLAALGISAIGLLLRKKTRKS